MNANDDKDVSIFLVSEIGEIILPDEYDIFDNIPIQFIMLTNDALNSEFGDDNTIFFKKDWWYVDKPKKYSLFKMRCISPKDNEKIRKWALEDLEQEYKDTHDKYNEDEKREYIDTFFDEYLDECFDDIYAEQFEYIYPNHKMKHSNRKSFDSYIWQLENILIEDLDCIHDTKEAQKDFNGYKYTINALGCSQKMSDKYMRAYEGNREYPQITISGEYFPAIYAAYTETVKYKNEIVHGFLPSIGQLYLIYSNIDMIRSILKGFNQKEYMRDMLLEPRKITSSTQCDKNYHYELTRFGIEIYDKTRRNESAIFALFPIKI